MRIPGALSHLRVVVVVIAAVTAALVVSGVAHAYTVTPQPYGFYLAMGVNERVEVSIDTGFAGGEWPVGDWEWDGVPVWLRRQPLSGPAGGSQVIPIEPSSGWRLLLFNPIGASGQQAIYIPPGWPAASAGGGSVSIPNPLPVTVGNWPSTEPSVTVVSFDGTQTVDVASVGGVASDGLSQLAALAAIMIGVYAGLWASDRR